MSCPGTRRIRRHSPASARTWRLRAWPNTGGPNVSNFDALNIPPDHPAREMQDTLIDAPSPTQTGKVSKVTVRAGISAKLEHETTPRRPTVTA